MIGNKQDQIYMKKEIEEIVKMVRLELYNKGIGCGSKAIKKGLEECYQIESVPSESTIGRVLSRHGLTYNRTGFY
jgi:hypothetical protein